MEENAQRESMDYDVLIVGGGPASLATVIRLKQLNPNLAVCLLEKSAEVGAHILSGAILDPRALNELIPDWQDLGAPVHTLVKRDELHMFNETRSIKSLIFMIPPSMHNHGNYVISLANFVRWLGEHAESLGVEIYPGFCCGRNFIP